MLKKEQRRYQNIKAQTLPFASPSISSIASHLKMISVELALTPDTFFGDSLGAIS